MRRRWRSSTISSSTSTLPGEVFLPSLVPHNNQPGVFRCGHCKALGPEFVKAGQMLKEKDSPIKLGKVDGTEEEQLMDAHNVTGYPTLKLYRKKSLVPYTGGRMAPEIVDWLQKKIGPPAKLLETVKDVKDFIRADVSVLSHSKWNSIKSPVNK